jgi:hypothetical protein
MVSNSYTRISGAGMRATTIIGPPALKTIHVDGTPAIPLRGFQLDNLTILNGSVATVSGLSLVLLDNVGEDVAIRDVRVDGEGFGCTGIKLLDSWMVTLDNIHFESFEVATQPALWLVSSGSTSSGLGHPMNSIRVNNCTWQHCMNGVQIHDTAVASPGYMHSITFLNPRFKRYPSMTGAYGIRMVHNSIFGVNIINGFFEDIEFPVVVYGYNTHIDGALIEHSTTAIRFQDGEGHVADNIIFTGGATNGTVTGIEFASGLTGPCALKRYHMEPSSVTGSIISNSAGGFAAPLTIVPFPSMGGTHGAVTIGAAGRTIYQPFHTDVAVALEGVAYQVGTSSGNISVALYDAKGARLVTSGAVACPASGRQTTTWGGAKTIPPGDYMLALSCDNNTATFAHVDNGTSSGLVQFQAVHPAPTTAVFAGATANTLQLRAKVAGSIF